MDKDYPGGLHSSVHCRVLTGTQAANNMTIQVSTQHEQLINGKFDLSGHSESDMQRLNKLLLTNNVKDELNTWEYNQ